MKNKKIKMNDMGFTLIEVIIVIVIAAILATMIFTYSKMSFTKGSELLTDTTKTFALQKVMENISVDYNKNFKTNLIGLQTKIGGVEGGNEGSTQNNIYGNYTIVDNHFIKFINYIETPDNEDPKSNNILKVTIKNDRGERLSILFTMIIQ